jgi:hypothetical protein
MVSGGGWRFSTALGMTDSEAQKYMRVVLDVDGETVHTALFDRNYGRRKERAQP